MSYEQYAPHPALGRFVDRFWSKGDGREVDARAQRVLPDGCIDILIYLTDQPRVVVVGTMTRAFMVPPATRARIVAVRFRPAGAVPFLRLPAHEITDRHVGGTDLDVDWIDPAPLLDATSLRSAARLLEAQLLARLSFSPRLDREIVHVAGALWSPDPPSIDALAAELGWSRQHLHRTFRRGVGVAPKLFARIARLQRATQLLQGAPRYRLAAIASELGYFDQAHMSRDFRSLAGVTPTDVRRATGSIFPILPPSDSPW